jgi:hypothetical protein
MADSNEIDALKAAFRGALSTTAALQALTDRIASLDRDHDIEAGDLEDLARVTLAHAVSSQALRGLVETMRARRDSGGKPSV